MSIKEKVAYLKGLAEGLGLTDSKEGKLISVIIDTLSDMAEELDVIGESTMDISEELDAISDNLAGVEELLFEDAYDVDDYDDFDIDDEYFEDGDGCGCGHCQMGDGGFICEVECPACGEELELDESDLLSGEAVCPACGEKLEFEFDDDDESNGDAETENND